MGELGSIIGVIAPVFLLMLLGYGLAQARFFSADTAPVLIRYVWYIGIPALLFRSLAGGALPRPDEALFVLAYYTGLFTVYALAYAVLVRPFGLSAAERAVFALTSCFANIGFIGIPIAEASFGAEGVRLFLMLMSFHSLTLLPVTSYLVARARGKASGRSVAREAFETIKQNPVLISLVAGLSWSALGLPFPAILDKVLALPASSAAPVGLFAGGMALAGVKLAGDIGQSAVAVAVKLVLVPLVVWVSLRHVFALPDLWVEVGTLLAALPIGLIPYSFAQDLGVAPRRVASAVLISAGVSAVTLTTALILIRSGSV